MEAVTVLIGYGSHGRDIETIWHRRHGPISVLNTYDDHAVDNPNPVPLATAQKSPSILGVNTPKGRMALAERFTNPALPLTDPDALVDMSCRLGFGTVVAPRAVLMRDVVLGDHTHVNFGTMMTRCVVGKFVTIAPGVTICGDTEIGNGVFVGAGSIICDRVTIGNEVTIAAGAIVPPTSTIPNGTTVIGIWKGDCHV